jgi:hypothetical protein
VTPKVDPPIAPVAAAREVEPGGGRVEILAGAAPRFLAGLGALGRAAVAWIEGRR